MDHQVYILKKKPVSHLYKLRKTKSCTGNHIHSFSLEICEVIRMSHSVFTIAYSPPTVGDRPGAEVVNKTLADVSKGTPWGDRELQTCSCP